MHVDEPADMDELLRDLTSEITHVYRRLAEEAGINHTDLMCLYFVRTSDGTATPKTISQHLGLTSGATAIMLNRLEAGGFIERKPHPTDRRATLIHLGPATRDAGVLRVRDYVRDINRQVIDSYSAEEQALVRRFLTDMMSSTRDALKRRRTGNGQPES